MTIHLVAFDYGGVLTAPPFTALLEYELELGLPAGALCAEFRGGLLMREAEIGRRAVVDVLEEWRKNMASTHAVDVQLERIYESFRTATAVNPYMIDLLHRIDLPLALVTNNLAEARARWKRHIPVDRFSVVIDSSEVGIRKPDPEMWALLVERAALPPEEIVMVDDFEENIAGAEAAGLTGLHFRDGPSCEAGLHALGVSIRPPSQR